MLALELRVAMSGDRADKETEGWRHGRPQARTHGVPSHLRNTGVLPCRSPRVRHTMFPSTKPANATAAPDLFRGTVQRWTIDDGPLAGTACDYTFNADWTMTWRVVAGPRQGHVGRVRKFSVQPLRTNLFLVSFATAPNEAVTAAVDFASHRFVGFHIVVDEARPVGGSIHVL